MAPSTASKRERELVSQIRAMSKLATDAAKRGSFSPAVAARTKCAGLRADLHRMREERAAESETDPLIRVRRLRRLATEAASYTAAGALAKLEEQIVEARAMAARAAGDGLDEATDDEILAVVEGAILALPDVLVQRLRDACDARLAGPKLRVI